MKSAAFNILFDCGHGSSGKGAVSTRLADIHDVYHVSSCNFANAGHSVVYGDQKYVSKVIPTPGFLNAFRPFDAGNPGGRQVEIWIGPGSGFFKDRLFEEVKMANILPENVHIHSRAVVMSQKHIDMEKEGKSSTLHISSTMSGSGASLTHKMMRGEDVVLAGMDDEIKNAFDVVDPWDFSSEVQGQMDLNSETFLHEVSQGFALSIDYGTHYPFCTFRNSTPQQAMADMMVHPYQVGDIYMNVRSFPIRVGNNYNSDGKQVGYSGDFAPDQKEMTWEEIGYHAEMPADEIGKLKELEKTTVTRKTRRVATQSWQTLASAAYLCGATKQVLNFPQYIHWSAYKVRGGPKEFKELHPKVRKYIDQMEDCAGVPVVMIGTGPDHLDFIYLD